MADLTQKVVGFRYWRSNSGWLQSQGWGDYCWGRGVNEARCEASAHQSMMWSASLLYGNEAKPQKPHTAPGNGCTCGLHAYHACPEMRAGPFSNEAMQIVGAVAAWGRVEVHSNGFRAEKAAITALAFNDHWPRTAIEIVKTLAKDYEVDCVPLSQLRAFAHEIGDPVPPDLIPKKEPEPKPKPATVNPVKADFMKYAQQFYSPVFTLGKKGYLKP